MQGINHHIRSDIVTDLAVKSAAQQEWLVANRPGFDERDTKRLRRIQTCANCGAHGVGFDTEPDGRLICCSHCVNNPCGCRCKRGQYGVPETDCDDDMTLFSFKDRDD